jgi:mono/diheme cytochrome c family protein
VTPHLPRWLALTTLIAAFAACDNRETFRAPEPSLARMLQQKRGTPYGTSVVFADGRVMREPPAGTVPQARPAIGQPVVETGRVGADYVRVLPVVVTREALGHGREAFERVCATCHGILGDGNSVVAQKMELRRPPSLHEPRIAQLPAGKVFEVASLGYGLMPGFASMLDVYERWDVVGYLEALRASQAARVSDLPDAMRAELAREAP